MYYILRFLKHACSVIKFVILTIVCRSKSASELMLHCYVYSTLNKSSMSMSNMDLSHLPVCLTITSNSYTHRYLCKDMDLNAIKLYYA